MRILYILKLSLLPLAATGEEEATTRLAEIVGFCAVGKLLLQYMGTHQLDVGYEGANGRVSVISSQLWTAVDPSIGRS